MTAALYQPLSVFGAILSKSLGESIEVGQVRLLIRPPLSFLARGQENLPVGKTAVIGSVLCP